jgi:hypothetical protein
MAYSVGHERPFQHRVHWGSRHLQAERAAKRYIKPYVGFLEWLFCETGVEWGILTFCRFVAGDRATPASVDAVAVAITAGGPFAANQ